MDAIASILGDDHYKVKVDYLLLDTLDVTYNIINKKSTTRMGGVIKLGIDGELWDPWYVNISIGLGVMNLFGRKDARGELLTPIRLNEYKENYVYNLLFSMLIQYRL